ncbi:YceI family protein [Mucilaginibacter sp. UR6-1]|uniref:YceI family protein n=1 Tax=Mucilaginibacter sp. UR6-1 TaxID=1435643 RepID=UPI001E3EF699|nr:YceI family protein [Mucilaginibacter sp. UR6-1]MCC8410589.1 YceI family protein [Mucilaginibacter sp. UR6-1]
MKLNYAHIFKTLFILLLVTFTGSTVLAQTAISRAAVTYEVKNLGINTTGKFTGVKAGISFNPAQPASGSIEAAVDVNTVNSDNDTRDEHLKGAKFFDAAKYPTINIKSTSIQKKGSGYLGKFNLTIKGNTKPVDIPFTYTATGDKAQYKGSFKINRKDFNVGGSSMTLADEVTINIDIETAK